MADDAKNTVEATSPAPASAPAPASPVAKAELPEGVLAELPEDAAVHTGSAIGAAASHIAPKYTDKFAGQGGSYVIDPATGERKRRFEPVMRDGKRIGFRPVA